MHNITQTQFNISSGKPLVLTYIDAKYHTKKCLTLGANLHTPNFLHWKIQRQLFKSVLIALCQLIFILKPYIKD